MPIMSDLRLKSTTTAQREANPFYLSVLLAELRRGKISKSDQVLVVCGGNLDRITLIAAGFDNVVISNLAPHAGHYEYAPYSWCREDAEALSLEDQSYDIVIVHSGLHHCRNPVRALGEMCRAARKLVIAFEPYDTWFTRLGAKLGYGQQYEDQAVHRNSGNSGGVSNGEIPNFVYRFREVEIEKFARAFFPYGGPDIRFYRALRVNIDRFRKHRSAWLRVSFKLAHPLIQVLAKIIPSLNNNFCFTIWRPGPEDYHSWVLVVEGQPRVDKEFLIRKYGPFPE
jgi:SAM-dependent methyltransferase